jgi:hypothetical protein
VFQTPPHKFQQLEHLVVVDRNIAFADQTRQPVAAGRTDDVVQPTVCDVQVNSS